MSHVAVRDVDPVDASAVPDAGFDAPHLVTELPGPKARAHIAFDERYTSPSLPRAYPIVPVRGRGSVIEDIDGNRFLDFCAGIAVNVTGHGSTPALIGLYAVPFAGIAFLFIPTRTGTPTAAQSASTPPAS